jgi:BioD-like phosphotransacetylase family protein
MKAIYLVSEQGFSGLHTITLGLGFRLQKDGFKVGFFKPLGNLYQKEGDLVTDADTSFLLKTLDLDEELKDACPIILTPQLVNNALSGERPDYLSIVKKAYRRVSEGKDVILVQSSMSARQGTFLGLSSYDLARELETRVLMVERFNDALIADNVLHARGILGELMLGVIFNMISPGRQTFVQDILGKYLEETEKVPVLGMIPEDRLLKSISIRELAASLHGEVLSGEEALDNLVEGVIVGAMGPEHAMSFFRKRKGECVVTGGDRSDIQLAALEANVPCLVLSGHLYPSPIILGKADEMGVPVILVDDDTLSAAEKTDMVIKTARTREPKKLDRLAELLDIYVDVDRLYRLAGIK